MTMTVFSCFHSLRRRVVWAGILLAGIAATGCSQNGATSGDAGGGDPAAPARLKIAAILCAEDQFYQMIQLGMKDAARELDVELLVGNSTGMVDKEISLLEAYAAQGAQAVAIAPASVTASIPGLQAAHDAGLKVVTYDNFIKANFPVSNIQSDQVNLGASMGRAVRAYVDKNLGGKAKLAMIEALAVSPEVCAQRVQGFKQGLGEASGIEIVAEQDAWMAPMAADVAESLMGANPEINLIWAANEGGTVGAVTAVRNSGKAGKVVVFGTDMSDQIGTFLGDADGVLIAVAGQRAFEIGGNAIKAAVAAVRGVEVEPAQKLPGIEFSRDAPEAIAQFRASLSAVHGDGAATTGGAAGAAGAGQ